MSRMFLAEDVDTVLMEALALWQGKAAPARREPSASEAPETPSTSKPEKKAKKEKKDTFEKYRNAKPLRSTMNVFSDPCPEVLEGDAAAVLKTFAAALEAAWVQDPVRVQLLGDLEKCRLLVRELTTDDGWQVCRESDNSRTLYRKEEGIDTHSFRVSGVIDCELMDLFAVIYEAEMYGTWFPFMEKSTELASVSRFHKLVRMKVGMPWPLAAREFILNAFGVDNTEQGRVLISIQSIAADDTLHTIAPEHHASTFPPEGPASPLPAGAAAEAEGKVADPVATGAANAAADAAADADAVSHPRVRQIDLPSVIPKEKSSPVRCPFHRGGYMLELLTPTTTRVSFFCNVDPKVSVLPTSLFNFAASKLIHTIVGAMGKAARNTRTPGSKWQERIAANKPVYDDVQRIVQSCLQNYTEAEANANAVAAETDDAEEEEPEGTQ